MRTAVKSTRKDKLPAKAKLDFLDDWVEDEDNDDYHSPFKKKKTEEDNSLKEQETTKNSSIRKSLEDMEDDNDEKDSSSQPTCLFCQAKFSSVEAVQDHIKLSHRDRPNMNTELQTNASVANTDAASFEIDSTTDIIENQKQQTNAIKKKLPSRKSYKCNLCGIKKVSLKFIQQHVKEHKKKISLQCKYCGATCKNIASLKVHASKCHKVASAMKKCGYCKFKFSDFMELKNHVKKVHSQQGSKKPKHLGGKGVTNFSNEILNDINVGLSDSEIKEKSLDLKTDSCKISVGEVSSTSLETDAKQKFYCPMCDVLAHTESDIMEHLEKCHKISDIMKKEDVLQLCFHKEKNKVTFQCPECGVRKDRPSQLAKHASAHKASTCLNLGICIYCEKLFMNKDQLVIHSNAMHDNFKITPRCSVCEKVYSYEKDLKIHHLKCHFSETAEQLLKQVSDQKMNKSQNISSLNSKDANDIYSKVFKELQDLTGEGSETEDLSVDGNTLVPLTYSCPMCNFNSQDQEIISTHLKSHTQNYCNICQNILNPEEAIRHIENHSIDFQGKKCSECESKCHDEIHLQLHLQKSHPGKKPHKCTMCEKSYLTQKSLLQHKHLKHGESAKRTFSCNKCKMNFYSEKSYQTHVEFAHRVNLNCRYCDKSLSEIKKLVVHEKNHLKQVKSIHKCNICGKVLKSQTALKTHKINHASSKPLKCEMCNHSFKSFHALREHSAKHTNVQQKKYFCEICGKGFYFYDSHIRHRKIHLNPLLFHCKMCKERFQTKQKLEDHKKQCSVENKLTLLI